MALGFLLINKVGSTPVMLALSNVGAYFVFSFIGLLTFTPGFLVHEIAHKIQARKYGCWAEFRASSGGLRFGVILAALIGVVLMAPGAVMVAGNTTREQFGKIALAGPVSNEVLWSIRIVCAVSFGGASAGIDVLIRFWLNANSVLRAFNMLPFGPLDGKKIRTWSVPIFWIWLIICFSTVWFTFTQLSPLLG